VEADDSTATTRLGRVTRKPHRLIEEIGATFNDEEENNDVYGFMQATMAYSWALEEFGFVGAGLGGGFTDTNELHVMKYNKAIQQPDKDRWKKAVEEEHQQMVDAKVFKVVKKSNLAKGTTIILSTWAMKKKANGTYRGRLNGRGYEQVERKHYDETNVSSPVVL